MAIQFARCQYVSRSTGGNACRKASYNQREELRCERTGEVFSFKERGDNVHHEIILPIGADARFIDSAVLWNEAERCEKRKDSQVAKEFVIALPDNKEITFEDRIELSRMFASIFVEKGVAVQLDIHEPHDGEKNWHTHFLVTTRRFSEDGQTFFSKKATDLDPVFRNGVVVEADVWGEIWRDLQNTYFEEKGYDLRVDPIGIVPQEHLGPVRMRHHMNEAIQRSQMLQVANEKLSQDPVNVIEALTQNRAIFTTKDLEIFLNKHVPFPEREGLLKKVLDHGSIIPLYDKENGKQTVFYTTQEVRAEEEKLIRFADRIAGEPRESLDYSVPADTEIKLSDEQQAVYDHCVNSEKNLCIVQGRAGVGKSTVLNPIRMAHEERGYRVLGLTPTHKVAQELKADGFEEAKTCHSFLFAFKNKRETLNSNTLVVVDEAGMLGTELSVELFHTMKASGAKLLLVGDDRQLSAVARGGVFGHLAERYGAIELQEVRRQTIDWQKAVSEDLSKGDIKNAVSLLEEHKAIQWKDTKEDALSDILKDWAKESLANPQGIQLILAQRNIDVDALNQGARDILREQGRLGDLEVTCVTQRGKMSFAEGDRVQFTKTDKTQGLYTAEFGTIQKIDPETKKLTVLLDSKEQKEVDPYTYDGLRHGYASTVYKAQGSTLDHVYVLHSKIINKSVNYVALTRQTKSLSLYVSKDETPTQAHLIRQMNREDGNKTSLYFATQKEIDQRQEDNRISATLKRGTEKIVTKVKDFFHTNEEFYKFDQAKQSIHKADVSLSNRDLSSSSSSAFDPSAGGKEHTAVSEDLKRAMLGDEFYNRIYKPKEKAVDSLNPGDSQPITEELKRTMLGEEFYNRAHNQKIKIGTSHDISEDLKKAMVGEEFYNRAHGKKQDLHSRDLPSSEAEKLSQSHADAESLKDSVQEEQKVSHSIKPPSPGKRR